jgi:hypothetical protein
VSAVSTHKFKIGESVFVIDVRAPATPFVVVKRMPDRDGEFEYRVRSSYEVPRACGPREPIENHKIRDLIWRRGKRLDAGFIGSGLKDWPGSALSKLLFAQSG